MQTRLQKTAPVKRVFLTGISGFIGRFLREGLEREGWEVLGLSRLPSEDARLIQGDLTQADSLLQALEESPPFQVLIHGALAANSGSKNSPEINERMTRNLLEALRKIHARPFFIHLSSIAVYGEAGRNAPISPGDKTRPADSYGKSKLLAEAALRESDLSDFQILRLAPVFQEKNLRNLRVRVYPPGLPLKARVLPEPSFSLCPAEELLSLILDLVRRTPPGRYVRNACSSSPFSQTELAARFPGRSLPLPEFLFRPLYWALGLLGGVGYKYRCLYWKFFRDNLYDSRPLRLET